jgi:hypothetical protein
MAMKRCLSATNQVYIESKKLTAILCKKILYVLLSRPPLRVYRYINHHNQKYQNNPLKSCSNHILCVWDWEGDLEFACNVITVFISYTTLMLFRFSVQCFLLSLSHKFYQFPSLDTRLAVSFNNRDWKQVLT